MLRIKCLLTAALLGGSLSLATAQEAIKTVPRLDESSTPPNRPNFAPTSPTDGAATQPGYAPPAGQRSSGLLPRLAEMMKEPGQPVPPPGPDLAVAEVHPVPPHLGPVPTFEGPYPPTPKPPLVKWLSYRPLQLTCWYYLCMPYNPRPPLYLYFGYPPPLCGPHHPYPFGKLTNCWNGHCQAGPPLDPRPQRVHPSFGPQPPAFSTYTDGGHGTPK